MSLATFVAGHRAATLAAGAALVLVVGGVTAAAVAARSEDPVTPAVATAAAPSTPDPGSGAAGGFQDPAAPSYTAPPADATPVRVQIPSIGVDSGLEDLGLGSQGELDPPKEWQSAGWYGDGVVPGAVGPAVIAGHVDSGSGPAVFVDLAKLVPGDEVQVTLSTGSVETFRVTGSERTPKATFPTSDVYGASPTPGLRLITCDGTFDRSTGHYVDNLIVFADLVTS
ncbi:class F sortase [Frigoribacterium sp. VKM Ac-2836]|uniref:class F sortase n=1 Tax=Frigoribacterium sp. VKM Ac-2836 TaxID=2739014 RepID=UPI0015658C71|nr:class F sortase [Frigoribacterium sp. VKM Ac-2836]NRD27237.1 class F sortase [Frigoribacterium sp. VKM Ac-2836]